MKCNYHMMYFEKLTSIKHDLLETNTNHPNMIVYTLTPSLINKPYSASHNLMPYFMLSYD